MKFTVKKSSFLKILQRLQGIVEKRSSMPILSNVLLDVKADKINATATDLEIFIKDSTEADITKEGSITINSRKFFEIIKELPEESISIEKEDELLKVKSGRAKFEIPGISASEYPAFPRTAEENLTELDGKNLKRMIDHTLFATSTDETRYNINGIYIEKEADNIKMVATDGHRLALMQSEGINIEGLEKGVILPRKGVIEIKKLLEDGDETVSVGFGETSVTVKKGETLMNVRLIEGEFPDYNQVIPENTDKILKVDKNSFLSALKRVSILSADKIKGVKFSLRSGTLVLSSSTPENGEAVEEIDVDYDGLDIEIAFNARYFIEVLEALSGIDKVKVELKEQLNPGVLKSAEEDDFLYVIMPMRL